MEREDNLVAAFSYFDKDGSGYITIDELQQACKDFGLGDLHLDETIKEIDLDNCHYCHHIGSKVKLIFWIMMIVLEENLDEWPGDDEFRLKSAVLPNRKVDGRIDYGEFATMMRKGDGGVGRTRTVRSNLNFNIADAFGVDALGMKDATSDAK
ncbi:hypothetical protein SADUNF_Sadunf13G0089500 [Salix dunnii]|uniref:EF-hand domain-containing protein n=1 Tax=Salix dunnii TaxID=1413687 RepID=A0A835JJW6_9ROSI|nr:hypothetical protein SADUNF_Sadunf13G0089500 [Salix dunnii]